MVGIPLMGLNGRSLDKPLWLGEVLLKLIKETMKSVSSWLLIYAFHDPTFSFQAHPNCG